MQWGFHHGLLGTIPGICWSLVEAVSGRQALAELKTVRSTR
jgi:hypothetical protein